jgi:creatinine amidohydrolase/Fe(II)-dependent formamide hydrolase-like protein
MDVRDKIRSGGFKRVIIPTGGIEQNGPFVALNKHDIIAEAIAVRAAKLANGTLVAPVVSFTPEGQLSPPTGHMHYAGTISVTNETFIRLLTDIGLSLAVHGFTDIVLIGDSGDSQTGLQEARQRLQRAVGSDVSVRFIHDFYDYDEVRSFLRERGVRESQSPFHEELAFSLQLLALKPAAIRYEERIQAGFTSLGDVSLLPREKLTALGEAILNQRASKLARLIQGQ